MDSTLIQDSMSELTMYRDDLQTKLAPYTQDAAERLAKDLQNLADKLRGHMIEARKQMEIYSTELQTMMEQNADDVRARVFTYTRKIKKRLNKDTQDIKRWVKQGGWGELCSRKRQVTLRGTLKFYYEIKLTDSGGSNLLIYVVLLLVFNKSPWKSTNRIIVEVNWFEKLIYRLSNRKLVKYFDRSPDIDINACWIFWAGL